MIISAILLASFARLASPADVAAEPAPAPASEDLDLPEISRRVEEIRGLAFEQAVRVERVDAAMTREYVRRRIDRFASPREVAAEERVDEILGLLPTGTSLREAYAVTAGDAAAGFYDPEEKTFYLLEDLPPVAGPILAAHELTHALEDQHYDLDARIQAAQDDADRSFAISALHEGSATLVMATYTARALSDGSLRRESLDSVAAAQAVEQERLAASAPVLRRPLLGAYMLGAAFLARGDDQVVRGGRYPAADVDRAFRNPPVSSEQLLHPEKYWGPAKRDDPKPVGEPDLSAILGAGWVEEASGRFGELFLGLLVGATTPSEWSEASLRGDAWTNEAAAGWGGDAWSLWTREKKALLAVLTSWDSARDARQFARAASRNPRLRLERRGIYVAVVAGDFGDTPPAALLRSLLDARGAE